MDIASTPGNGTNNHAAEADTTASSTASAPGAAIAVPQLQDIQQVSDGWVKKYILTYLRPDGDTYTYECISRKNLDDFRCELEGNAQGIPPKPDAVCIVGRTPNDELLLIREFRYPLNSWCIAFPAGLIEPGESIEHCVTRELYEEVGFAPCTVDGKPAIEPLPQAGYSSNGLTDETVHIVFAQIEKNTEAHLEPSEFIEPFLLPIANVAQFLAENKTPIGTRAQLLLEMFARRH